MTKVRESGIRFITLIYNKHGTHVWKKTGLGQENTALSCQLCSSIKSLSPMSHCSECLKLAIKLISTMQSTELIGKHPWIFVWTVHSQQIKPVAATKILGYPFKKKISVQSVQQRPRSFCFVSLRPGVTSFKRFNIHFKHGGSFRRSRWSRRRERPWALDQQPTNLSQWLNWIIWSWSEFEKKIIYNHFWMNFNFTWSC